MFLHRAERVSSVFQKNMAFRDQGTVEATAPLFGVIAGTLPEREPARLPDARPVRLSKMQETGHIYYSRLSVPFAIRSSCPIIERPRFFKAIRMVSPTPPPSFNFNRPCGSDVAQMKTPRFHMYTLRHSDCHVSASIKFFSTQRSPPAYPFRL